MKSRLSSLGEGGGKNAHLPTRVYNDHGCDYVQLPGRPLLQRSMNVAFGGRTRELARGLVRSAKETAIGRKVDGICATRSGHVVKTMTVKTF